MSLQICFIFEPGTISNCAELVDKFYHEGFGVIPCKSEYMRRIKDLKHPAYAFMVSVFPDESVVSLISGDVMPDDMERMLREMLCVSKAVSCELYADGLRITTETIEFVRKKYEVHWAAWLFLYEPMGRQEYINRELEELGIENIIESKDSRNSPLDLQIDELKLSGSLMKYLKGAGITFVGELVQMTPEELKQIRCVERKSIDELSHILGEMGLSLEMKIKDWPPRWMIN